ncbi:hypothetical protein J2T17_004412 [Paenibacillus mucilaginosus]|uniref:Rad52/Rad22 family DNA repair protein n=1 Tax=Paenibacillus mucilaginosus TaxID=61624 RepID=UPI003D1B593F
MSDSSKNLSVLLNEPFPYEAYKATYDGQPYVSVQWIVERLNTVLGPTNWRHEFYDVTENMHDKSVELIGRLSIWDAEKGIWLERVNWGNDTMTIARGATEPTAQDRMNAKKSSVSDSLKKCAAWFGAASDVFKGMVTIIKPEKYNGDPNLLYTQLVSKYPFVNQYGAHKYGIPVLPDSYREFYEKQGWSGIFASDLKEAGTSAAGSSSEASPSASSGTGTGRAEQKSSRGSRSTGGSTGSSTGSGSSGNGNSTSKKPESIRMKVMDVPKFNPDGTSTFKAQLLSKAVVTVHAGKELKEDVQKLQVGMVVQSNGWVYQHKVTLGNRNNKIQVESAA